MNKPIEDILHNLWVKAELFQHQLEAKQALDMRRPDQARQEATQAIIQYIDTEIIGEDVGVSSLAKMDEYWKGQNALRAEQRQRLNKEG